jgi:Mn-dependent DtxR family transcriptional regulator
MGRKTSEERLERIYRTVEQYPGRRAGFLAWLLGLNRSEVTRALPGMEKRGWLLSEDERGGLWPFRRK